MKRNVHTIVKSSDFILINGEDVLSTYTFNTHTAKHKFCSNCGVVPFYIPRSNPDGIAITIYCIEPGTLLDISIKTFSGKADWEGSFEETGISEWSK